MARKLGRAPGPSAPQLSARVERPPPPPGWPDPLARETTLIAAARAALVAAPSAALARLDDHRREFPDGQLAPEREFLAVDALRRLDRVDEAHERVLDLQRRFPSSSYGIRASVTLEATR